MKGPTFNWSYERAGDWTFRAAPSRFGFGFLAEAKRGDFVQSSNCVFEPGDCWFEYGKTAEEAVSKLKRELLS